MDNGWRPHSGGCHRDGNPGSDLAMVHHLPEQRFYMVIHLLDAPRRAVNDVLVTSSFSTIIIATSAAVRGAPCPAGRG